VDLLSPELIADPHPHFSRLRERDPVHWSERHRAWILLRYDDVTAGFRDPAFSSERADALVTDRKPGPAGAAPDASARVLRNWMEFRDPPDHTRLRRLVQKAFPLPAIVIAELLGVPAQDRDLFKSWSEDIKGLVFGSPEGARLERAQAGFAHLEAYFERLIERLTRDPADNLLSALCAAREAEDLLRREELIGTAVLLLFGGHETTTNLLSTGLRALALHPEQRACLAADPDLIAPAVEELLRWDGPLKLMVRRAREDRELRGCRIRAGDRVFLVMTAANRDPDVFPDPDRLDLSRVDNAHIAFGHGSHFCLGAPLARVEARIALSTVLQRFPELSVETERPEWQPSILGRSLLRLPVRLGRGSR
jgi:cytochrome P450